MNEVRVTRRTALKAVGAASAGALIAANSAQASEFMRAALSQEGTPTGGEYRGYWAWTPPPIGHFNTFVADSLTLGIYQGVQELSLMHYRWDTEEFLPLLAESYEITPENVLVVKLRAGVTWSDGSTFGADDVITTFSILRIQNHNAWKYLSEVRSHDPLTVEFVMGTPSTVVAYYVLRAYIRAHSVYGSFTPRIAEATASLGASGTPVPVEASSAAFAPIVEELNQLKLTDIVVTGPYKVDPTSISSAQLNMTKVSTSFLANTANFDNIVLYAETDAASIPTLILAGNIDYATSGFPPATEQAMIGAGLRIVRPPTYFGPALYINYEAVKAFNNPRARGAVAQAIDRKVNGMISLADSGLPSDYMAGVSDTLLRNWVDESVLAELNSYPYDVAAATAIFEELGYTRDGDTWVSPEGEKMEYELIVAAEYADWAACATNLADQLTSFGIKTVVRTISAGQFEADRAAGNFQLGIGEWGSGQPHPSFSFIADLVTNNSKVDVIRKGISYEMVQPTNSVGEVDFAQLIIDSAKGMDETTQRDTIATLAKAFNELLPIIPIWERLANDPILVDKRVTGFPDDSHPLYQNGVYSDNFTIQWILDGTLKGVV
jgi:peptide/nickel transport system substrate-binding protein